VLIVAYIIYNFVFIKEGMDETPIYNNKDTGACTSALGVLKQDGTMDGNAGDHNPENRFKRFKSTLEDRDFKQLLKESKPEYKTTDIKIYDIEHYFDFASTDLTTTTNFNDLTYEKWIALDNLKTPTGESVKTPTGESVTQHLFNQISSTCEKYNQIKNLNNPGANRILPSFGSTTSSVATSSGDNDGGYSANMTPEEIKKANDEYQAYLKSQNGDSGPGVEVEDGDEDDEDDEGDEGDEGDGQGGGGKTLDPNIDTKGMAALYAASGIPQYN
jgi:hypothetical protein